MLGKSRTYFSARQVARVIAKMSRGKSPGHDRLSIEHLKHAGVHLASLLSIFFTLCISHPYLPPHLGEDGGSRYFSELTTLFQYWYKNQINHVRWGPMHTDWKVG